MPVISKVGAILVSLKLVVDAVDPLEPGFDVRRK